MISLSLFLFIFLSELYVLYEFICRCHWLPFDTVLMDKTSFKTDYVATAGPGCSDLQLHTDKESVTNNIFFSSNANSYIL